MGTDDSERQRRSNHRRFVQQEPVPVYGERRRPRFGQCLSDGGLQRGRQYAALHQWRSCYGPVPQPGREAHGKALYRLAQQERQPAERLARRNPHPPRCRVRRLDQSLLRHDGQRELRGDGRCVARRRNDPADGASGRLHPDGHAGRDRRPPRPARHGGEFCHRDARMGDDRPAW